MSSKDAWDSTFLSRSEAETFGFARKMAESLKLPAHILLFGDLGAGKTTFTKGLASGFGLENANDVSSPTFTLVNEYAGRVPIFHIDLYRIAPGDFEGLGLEDIFDNPNAVAIIEWAERLGDLTPPDAFHVHLTYVDPNSRRIEIERD